ncbi:nif11-like leader peptide domain protein [Synechococcus sp. BIOS-E4-1]|uniref:Nif11-like leader peptide family natural product precursor n=1 Tax=Synechococcus sp. BIOS-E4-1 TaxID=1400864 RepID=UPI0016463FBB|nr:Nif11-like leader peptide family natural product precursor [Synechococcus sp. BIOS-E4-1]QNI56169.1 nif11-like leader peptide domain protein [Synechococcus sp. BIOS-E4-1]
MTTTKLPVHEVNLAQDKGHVFTEAIMMKMQAEKRRNLRADRLDNDFSWGEALLSCFGNHHL